MDMIASVVGAYLFVAIGIWSLIAGFAGGFAYKKSNDLGISMAAGLTPLLVVAAFFLIISLLPNKPEVTVINGKAYTAATLPQPSMDFPKNFPVDYLKNLDFLQTFGIDESAIELCRKKGCRVVFTSKGGISSYGPVNVGDWQYTLDPATEKWKLKD